MAAEELDTSPGFIPEGSLALAFTPDPQRTSGAQSPEACEIERGEPRGTLTSGPGAGMCHSAMLATTTVAPAEFTSAAFEHPFVVGGEGRLVLHVVDPANPGMLGRRVVVYELDELTADGDTRNVGSGQLLVPPQEGRNEFPFDLNPSAVTAGSRLRIRFNGLDGASSSARMLFGGGSYGDAGLTLTTGRIEIAPIPALGVGQSAFWQGSDRAATDANGVTVRDYPLVLTEAGATLRVALTSPDYFKPYSLELLTPSGTLATSERAAFSSVEVFVDEPAVGSWTVRVPVPSASDSGFQMRAMLEGTSPPAPSPAVPLLPNIRLVPPFEFTFGGPPLSGPPGSPQSVPNCSPHEVVEEGGRRCLRFSVGPANEGPGPLQVRFESLQGLVTEGQAYQRIFSTDGSFIEREAGRFLYHKTHAHYHHSGFGSLELLKVIDPVAGTMVNVGSGPKQGFCTADVMMFGFDRFIHARERTESQCANDLTPIGTNGPVGTIMGITPGWADLYLWSQDGNYVEFGANGDGDYVVRSTSDASDWILETNETDNTSYAFIRITGEQITVLERGFGSGPWDTAKVLATDGLRLTP